MSESDLNPCNEPGSIKCVVWDLDNTIWDGILLEDKHVTLRDNVESSIKALDHRGILHSIASKNDHNTAIQKLDERFCCSGILGKPKSYCGVLLNVFIF